MPVQTTNSSFAKRLGARVAQANAEHRDKPIDTGNRRLPAGIKSGVAKLSAMYTKVQEKDDGACPKGETFFRASAVVMSPESHDGMRIAGVCTTQVIIPLCDVPAKGLKKAVSFSDNWYDFQNTFKLLGITPPPETPQTDPTGQRTEAYYFAAMKALTDPKRPPVYIEFSTRGWTPKPTPQQPKPNEIVFETWHGLATFNGQHDPAAGVTEAPPSVPDDRSPPPPQAQAASPPSVNGPPPQHQPDEGPLGPEDIAALVEIAMADPEGKTADGAVAGSKLEDLAWANGWGKDATRDAKDWSEVGDMALNGPDGVPSTKQPGGDPASTSVTQSTEQKAPILGQVTVGSKWKYAKRTKEGVKLKDNKGQEFPPQEVEVVTTDLATKTCTLKTVKDGQDVLDIRTRKPAQVKWDWLEP